jgi:hypothetical protein
MRTSHRRWPESFLAGLLIVLFSTFAQSSFPNPQVPNSEEIPVVKGGAGSCTADFVVKDLAGKGIYKANIEIQLRYGFISLHRLELIAPTNFEGKARFEGLPEKIKGTAEFKITHQNQSKSLPFDPQANCHPLYEVVLEEK